MTRKFGRLGGGFNSGKVKVSVSLKTDEQGYIGRECPVESCLGYFKVKPGTGITGREIPCVCPYCGHTGSNDTFFTKEQIAYGRSLLMRKVHSDLATYAKRLEFNRPAKGPFGIGLSFKVKTSSPPSVRHYREKALETSVTCVSCTLEYAVFGVFAFCPDCSSHNSQTILRKNLDLVEKQLCLAEGLDDTDLRRNLIEDALENCVSSLDGFGREAVRIRSHHSTDAKKCEVFSFQSLDGAASNLAKLFGADLPGLFDKDDWESARILFLKRHLLAHKAGVIDQKFTDAAGSGHGTIGRRITVDAENVRACAAFVEKCGAGVIAILPNL